MIKPLNHEEHEERDRWIQAAISPSILHQILISTRPWMRKWERKMMESRETRGMVCRQLNLIESNSNAYNDEEQVYLKSFLS